MAQLAFTWDTAGAGDRQSQIRCAAGLDPAEQNKRDVFRATRPRHTRDRAAIAQYLQKLGRAGATRHEIALALHLPLTTVCGRVNELKKLESVIEPGERRPTPAGKTAVVVVWKQ